MIKRLSNKLGIIMSVMMIMAITLQGVSSVVLAEKLQRMPKDQELNLAFDNAKGTDNFDIILVGKTGVNLSDIGVKCRSVGQLDQVASDKNYKSIWLSADEYNSILDDENGVQDLDKYLDEGYTLYFLGLEDINVLSEKFTGDSAKETIVNGDKQIISYVSKNLDGEYFFGHYFSSKKYTEKEVLKSIVASAWNRRNDLHYTRKEQNSDFSDLFTTKVKANSGEDFTIGTGWSCRFGWNQYNFSTDNGNYTEWKAGFYLTRPVDGKDYYAIAMESCMAPYNTSGDYSSDYLRIYSDLKKNKSGQLLRSYAPKQSPSSSTFSFNIGGSYSKDGPSGGIGASWETSMDDIEVLDSSQPSVQVADFKFNYKWPWGYFTNYSTHTSWQNSAIICQGPTGSTSAIMNNKRTAQFAMYGPMGSIWTDSNYLELNSTVTKA